MYVAPRQTSGKSQCENCRDTQCLGREIVERGESGVWVGLSASGKSVVDSWPTVGKGQLIMEWDRD